MATVDDAARQALAEVDTDAGFLRAVGWASDRYREITNRSRFRALRRVGELRLPPKLSTGTVTVTRDFNIVTGNAAATATWTDDLAGRYIRTNQGRGWQRIAAMVGTDLRLETPWGDDTQSGASYEIVKRFHDVDPRARHLGKFVWMRFGRDLENITLTEMDIRFPDRLTVAAGGPLYVTEIGMNEAGTRQVEVYPYVSTESEVLHYVFWPHSPRLRPGDNLPEPIDPYILREGVLVDIYRWEAAKALRTGGSDAAAIWGNWAARQTTLWNQAIRDAGKADKGFDDVTLILRSGSSRSTAFGYNNTAQTEIYIRGNRP